MTREYIISLLLRVAIAVSFLYPPIAAIFDPFSWIGYFPAFVTALPVSDVVLLHIFGVLEVIIALWILSGRHIFYPSVIAAGLLIGIIIFNFAQIDVLFRDVGLALVAIALAVKSYGKI